MIMSRIIIHPNQPTTLARELAGYLEHTHRAISALWKPPTNG